MAKKILYGLEDYARDRYEKASPVSGVTKRVSITPTAASTQLSRQTRGEGQRLNQTTISSDSAKNIRRVEQRTVPDVDTTSQAANAEAVAGTGSRALTANELTLIRRLDDMTEAQDYLLEVMSRKFQYDETASPLYTIMQKQRERDAEKAAGQAYARATANTGGYGSSYAAMAGEEARRQVMESYDNMQDELYQAALDEFNAERQSATEWYSAVRQMAEDQRLLVSEERTALTDAINALRTNYGQSYNEAAMRADLQAMGLSEEQISSALANQKQYSEGMATVTDENGLTQGASDAYNYILSLGDGVWTGSNEEQIRAMLNNQATAGGWTKQDVESAIKALKSRDTANIADYAKKFADSPTLAGAEELWEAAKSAGVDSKYKTQISTTVRDSLVNAMSDLEAGYEALGVDQAAWANLSQEDQKSQLLERAAQYKKKGMLSGDDFEAIIMNDVNDMVNAIDSDEITRPATEISNMVITWKNYKDRGYITEDEYNNLLDKVTDKVDAAATIKKQAMSLSEHASNWAGSLADSLNVSDWWKNFMKKGANVYTKIVSDYNPYSVTFIPSLLSNWTWVRKQILLNDEQEDAMEEILKVQKRKQEG